MAQGGFYERKRVSPTGITLVILLHGGALTALALSKMDMPEMKIFTPLKISDIPIPPDPQPIPEPKADPEMRPKSQIDYVRPLVPPLPRPSDDIVIRDTPDIPVFDERPIGKDADPPRPKPVPIPDPVRIEAQMLRTSALQPPYPAAEERAQQEGKVTIRVTIGANGRVAAAERVSATSDAFYRATERHALRAWRFKPATVDGKPVESRKTINLTFRLPD